MARTTPGLHSVTAGLYGGPMRGARRRQRNDETPQTPHSPQETGSEYVPDGSGPGGPGRHRPTRRRGRPLAIAVVVLLAITVPGAALYGVRWVQHHPHAMITFGDDHTAPARSSRNATRTPVPAPPSASPSASGSASPSGPASSRPVESAAGYEKEVAREINAARAKAKCGPLRYDSRLAAAARAHSDDMATRNYFDHTSPDGVTPWDRAKAVGYTDPSAENIAAGQATPAAVVRAWLASPGHRANILNCASHASGIGFATGGKYHYYWTQLFGYK
ncbi:hypothetical protein GCM10022220_05260 [Actinocatenispora rupis]|uniref:SCP domain-containing protein n=2 Tax=Actinocatenispora rupis TaxID=519421 RepID=A0A8J3JCM2_9ACTN|nr:hypothetical protein Aru02nite_68810 [Actinocatenispora rupis]